MDPLPQLFSTDPQAVTPIQVVDYVSRSLGVSVAEMFGGGRTRSVATARGLAMYLCRAMCLSMSYAEIGYLFGNRHHTTVIYHINKVSDDVARSTGWRAFIENCARDIGHYEERA